MKLTLPPRLTLGSGDSVFPSTQGFPSANFDIHISNIVGKTAHNEAIQHLGATAI